VRREQHLERKPKKSRKQFEKQGRNWRVRISNRHAGEAQNMFAEITQGRNWRVRISNCHAGEAQNMFAEITHPIGEDEQIWILDMLKSIQVIQCGMSPRDGSLDSGC